MKDVDTPAGSQPRPTPYEGYCQFCGREIGTGHEPQCPYYSHPDALRYGIPADRMVEAGRREG